MIRRTSDNYLEVGLKLLAKGSIDHVTIAAVCDELGVTKGSFYHHFDRASDFHLRMLLHWEYEYGQTRPAAIEGLPPTERLDAQVDYALDRDHALESAIRAWAHTDEVAAEVQSRLDSMRVDFCQQTLELCGVPTSRAVALAEMIIAILVGLQSRTDPVSKDTAYAIVHEYRRWMHDIVASSVCTTNN